MSRKPYTCVWLNCPLQFNFMTGALIIGLQDGAAFFNPATQRCEALDLEQWRDRFHEPVPELALEQWGVYPDGLTYRKGGARISGAWRGAKLQATLDNAKGDLMAHLPSVQQYAKLLSARMVKKHPRRSKRVSFKHDDLVMARGGSEHMAHEASD